MTISAVTAVASVSELVLKRMAAGVPGFSVNDVAFNHKMRADEVEPQLRAYVDKKAVERADEVASGAVRKLRFEQSIERIPETFFDLSPYASRLAGAGDCAIIAAAVAEGQTYSVAAAALSDSSQEDGGIRTIDFSRIFLAKPMRMSLSRIVCLLKHCGIVIS